MITATDRMIFFGFLVLIALATIFAPCLPVRAAAIMAYVIAGLIAYAVQACRAVDAFLRRRYTKTAMLAAKD